MTYFLPRVVGPSKALEILLDDPNMSAEDGEGAGARQRGGRRRRADASGRRAKAERAGEEGAPLRADGEAAGGVSIENSITEHLQLERHGIADSMATEDLRNGVETFFSGGTPEFHGR